MLHVQCVSNEYLKGRQPDEIEQMAKGLIVALGEMGRLAQALQQEEKAAKAAVVAAAAAGDMTAQTASKNHGNLSVQYINKMRDALIQGGVEAKLPPACAKVGCQGACAGSAAVHVCAGHLLLHQQACQLDDIVAAASLDAEAAGGTTSTCATVRPCNVCLHAIMLPNCRLCCRPTVCAPWAAPLPP